MSEGSMGSGGYVGIGKEVTHGTGVTPTTFLEVISESLKTSNQIIPSKAITASRSRKKAYMGQYKAGGDINFELGPENCGLLLLAAIGRVATTGPGGDGEYTHVMTTKSPEQTTSAATGAGTTTTTVDTVRAEADDYWNTAYISYITGDNAGETQLISDFDAATDTITHAAFSNATASGDAYVILWKLPSITVEAYKQIMNQRFVGGKVEALKILCNAGEIVTGTATVRTQKDDINVAASTPSFSTKDPFLYHGGTVKLGGVSSGYVPKVEFSLANELSGSTSVIGSRFDTEPHSQAVIVSGTFDVKFVDQVSYQQFLGASGQTSPQTSQTSTTLELELQAALIAGAVYNHLAILAPKIYYDTANANIGGPDEIIQGVEWMGVFKDTTDYELKATLINEVVSY